MWARPWCAGELRVRKQDVLALGPQVESIAHQLAHEHGARPLVERHSSRDPAEKVARPVITNIPVSVTIS